MLEALFLGALAADAELFGRDVDGGDVRAGRLRDMEGESAPAAADLGDGHAGLEGELGGGVDELLLLRLFERVVLGIGDIGAGVLHVPVEEEAVDVRRDVVMRAGVLRGGADRIGLVPAAQPAPELAQRALRAVARQAGTVHRKQQDEVAHRRAVLEGEGAVHVGFGCVELGVQEQLALERAVMDARGDGRARPLAAEHMHQPARVIEAERAVPDELLEQVRQQSHGTPRCCTPGPRGPVFFPDYRRRCKAYGKSRLSPDCLPDGSRLCGGGRGPHGFRPRRGREIHFSRG